MLRCRIGKRNSRARHSPQISRSRPNDALELSIEQWHRIFTTCEEKNYCYSFSELERAPTAPAPLSQPPAVMTLHRRGRPKPPEPKRSQAAAPPREDTKSSHIPKGRDRG